MSDMPTSPVNIPEVEAATGTSEPSRALSAPAASMVGEWRRLGAFLKRPSLDLGAQDGAPLTVLARIFALDLAIMFALIAIAGIVVAAGVELPETALAGMEFTPALIALVIFGAPVLEELIFRGWLPGRPSQLLILAGLIVAALLLAGSREGSGSVPIAQMAALGVVIVAVILAVVFIRRPTAGVYAKGFPVFFWLSTLAFALVHLANFEEGGAILLALVIPQFALGALLGYVRVRIGLWAAIVLHSAHNATAITIAGLASIAA